jgi:hypothetical protein
MVFSKSILKIPAIVSILIIIKLLVTGLVPSGIFFVCLICNTIFAIEFIIVVFFSLKFFNLEVPNDELPWSHN